MKRILMALLALSFSAKAQMAFYYLEVCDEVVLQGVGNSVGCLQQFYDDLQAYKKNPNFRFRYYESYNCVRQPNPAVFNRTTSGTDVFYKNVTGQLWKLYNDAYIKGGEIVSYVRLEDYKTNWDKGILLIREMQQIQRAIDAERNKVASKILAEAKALTPTNSFIKSYQLYLNAIKHEEDFLRKLATNFNHESFIGFPQDEILQSFLETEERLKAMKPSLFKIPNPAPLTSCYEGFEMMQQYKQHALDRFTNASTFDGQYLNDFYDLMIKQFNGDVLSFFAHVCANMRDNGALQRYYPALGRQFDLDAAAKPWPIKNLVYSARQLDSVMLVKQPAALPAAGFHELNQIVFYINECVRSMEDLFDELRSQEYTWERVRTGKFPVKNPIIKFDHFTLPISTYALIGKYSKDIPTLYRQSVMQRVDDVHQIMLTLQDHVFALSQHMSSGTYKNQNSTFLETELQTIEKLYSELDNRKEKLFVTVRQIFKSYMPAKNNSWVTASNALIQAVDQSRSLLHQTKLRVYEQDTTRIATEAIHESRRDLITNELKYMAGIQRIGKNNGLCPYNPYEYIPDYLNTLEEKIVAMPVVPTNKNKTYQDIRYMHNIIVEQHNKFAEIALGENEYAQRDPMRPVYLLNYIRQPMLYRYQPPKPIEAKPIEPTPAPVPEPQPAESPNTPITFEGYPLNNLVFLLDVSSSMNKPGRLPLLKKDIVQIIKRMRFEDEISIVAYSGKAAVVLKPTSAQDTNKIIKAIQKLQSSGITNIAAGLDLAYKTARDNFKPEGNNKIILATDGEFNMVETFYALAEKNASEIPLTVFDFSEKPGPIASIKTLAEKGGGNYVQVKAENSLLMLANEARKKN